MSTVAPRLLSILDVLERADESLSATEIGRRSGLPVPTAWRMLRELTRWGGVERQPDGRYRIATRLWAVGASAPCVRRLQRDTWFHLKALSARTGLAAGVAVFDGQDALLVSLAGEPSGGERIREGDRIPLGSGAIGKLFLALRSAGPANDRTPAVATAGSSVAAAITDPSGATVAALSLFGTVPSDARSLDASLRSAVGPVRFSIYQDELFV